MSTFLFDLAEKIEGRWQEVDLLIAKAQAEENGDILYYDALCRAINVLMVAHVEGYMKDVIKAIVNDVNQFSSFKDAPPAFKRTFCKTFINESIISEGKELHARINRLIEVFDDLQPKFIIDPFRVEGQYGDNKNPSPSVISKICTNMGIKNIFAWLRSPQLDAPFTNSVSDTEALIVDLRKHVLDSTQSYPYLTDISLFGMTEPSDNKNDTVSYYATFLNELLRKRHDVAHGNSMSNVDSIADLIQSRNKILIIEYAILVAIGHKLRQHLNVGAT